MMQVNNKIVANWLKIATDLQSQLVVSEEDKIKLSAEIASLTAEIERLREHIKTLNALVEKHVRKEMLQAAALTAEIERLTNAATNLLSALREYQTFKPDENSENWEDERMRVFEALNLTEAELSAALQPKEGEK